jgi:hypothetical protein
MKLPKYLLLYPVDQGKLHVFRVGLIQLQGLQMSTCYQDILTHSLRKKRLNYGVDKRTRFFNNCGIPIRSASSPEFRELMSFTVEHAAYLKKNQERLVVGHHKFSQISKKRLEELVFVVSSVVKESREYFYKATGKNVPRL